MFQFPMFYVVVLGRRYRRYVEAYNLSHPVARRWTESHLTKRRHQLFALLVTLLPPLAPRSMPV